MDYEIKQGFQIINNETCRQYSIEIPLEKIRTFKDEYPNIEEEESKEYFNYIVSKLPEDEKVITKYPSYDKHPNKEITFYVYTKKNKILKLEENISEIIKENIDEDFEPNYGIDINEDMWCCLRFLNIRYNEQNLLKIKKLLDAEDYEVCFNSHMEEDYLMYKLREETDNETYQQRVWRLERRWVYFGDLVHRLELIGIKKDSCLIKTLEEEHKKAWEEYSDAYDAYENIY